MKSAYIDDLLALPMTYKTNDQNSGSKRSVCRVLEARKEIDTLHIIGNKNAEQKLCQKHNE